MTYNKGTEEEELLLENAEEEAQETAAAQKSGYQSQWQDQLDEAMNRILNREKFSYDLNGDALYQQYKDKYIKQGQQAMMDTIGQQAALTGGYGNSWAQTAGQQAYQGYLGELNDVIPTLQQLALDKYNADTDELYNRYALIGDMDDREYEKYLEQEELKKWLATQDEETRNYYLNYGKEEDEEDGGTSGNHSYSIADLITSGTYSASGSSASSGDKTVTQLAQEVIAGKWGNGTARKNALEQAGYDYAAVQAAVNKLLGSSKNGTDSKTGTSGNSKTETKTSGGSSSSSGNYGTKLSLYDNDSSGLLIESDYDKIIVDSIAKGGATVSDVAQALWEEYEAGNISRSTYLALYKKHVSGKG